MSKRSGPAWRDLLTTKKAKFLATNRNLEHIKINRDRLNLLAFAFGSRPAGTKTKLNVAFLKVDPYREEKIVTNTNLGHVSIVDGQVQITPYYSEKTKKDIGLDTLNSTFALTSSDVLVLEEGKMMEITVDLEPDHNMCIVELINVSLSCSIKESKKSFYFGAQVAERAVIPQGNDFLVLLYKLDMITKALPHVSELAPRMKLDVAYSKALNAKENQEALKKEIIKKMNDHGSYQDRLYHASNKTFILHLGDREYDPVQYEENLPCGSDTKGRFFAITYCERDTHDKDKMEFECQISATDTSKKPAWRFLAQAVQATLPEKYWKAKENAVPLDAFETMQHSLRISAYDEVRTIGLPFNFEIYKELMEVYYYWLPLTALCEVASKGTLDRPELQKPEDGMSAYSMVIKDFIGPVEECLESLMIPISQDFATDDWLWYNVTYQGVFPSYKGIPSIGNGRRILCCNDLSAPQVMIKDPYLKENPNAKFWVLFKFGTTVTFGPMIFDALRALNHENTKGGVIGDMLVQLILDSGSLLYEDIGLTEAAAQKDEPGKEVDSSGISEEPSGNDTKDTVFLKLLKNRDADTIAKEYPEAYNLLLAINFFVERSWGYFVKDTVKHFVYAVSPTEKYTKVEEATLELISAE